MIFFKDYEKCFKYINIFRALTFFSKELDDSAIQEKIDHEARIRDGIVRLLAACHEEVQALETSKNLLTINARILALMGLLQRHRAKSVMLRKGSRYLQ